MLELTGRTISLSSSERLMKENFHRDLSHWISIGNAAWEIRDGALEGRWTGGDLEHGQLFCPEDFSGDIFIDGQLILEVNDPEPERPDRMMRIGFGVYQSHVRFRALQVLRPSWQIVENRY